MATTVVEQAGHQQELYKYANDCEKEGFRNFSPENKHFDRVFNVYKEMHTKQCVDFVRQKHKQWLNFDHGEYTIMEVLDLLNGFVDESDPDVDFPNLFHAYQTAEGLRAKYPDKDWFHLCGLVHDLGKVMALWGEQQWSTVGDTFIVGADFAPSVMYRESTFGENPDTDNPKYNTKYGIYKPNCGLNEVLMSWGHDEYMYQVLKHNNTTIPEEGLYCIRFHSFYPWHTGNDYDHLCCDKDRSMKSWVNKFNKHDLYTKSTVLPDVDALKPYYQSLVDKYIPGKLKW